MVATPAGRRGGVLRGGSRGTVLSSALAFVLSLELLRAGVRRASPWPHTFCPAAVAAAGRQAAWTWRRCWTGAPQRSSALARQAGPGGSGPGDLKVETRLLRENVDALAEEVRLLREALTGGAAAGAGQPSAQAPPVSAPPPAAAPRAPSPAPAPPPRVAASPPAPAPATSSFPTAPSQTPSFSSTASSFPAQTTAQPPSAPADRSGKSKVVVVSAGYDAGDIADFFVDDVLVPISGVEGRRGVNVVVINPSTGRITSAKSYDVWGDPSGENGRLAADLNALPKGHYVLVALKDSGGENLDMNAVEALEGLGATIDGRLAFREGYCLIGVKGSGAAIAERRSAKMLLIDAVLPFGVEPPMSASGAPAPAPAPAAGAAPLPQSQPTQGQQGFAAARQQQAGWSPGPPPAPAAPAPQQVGQAAAQKTDGLSWEEVLVMLDKLGEAT